MEREENLSDTLSAVSEETSQEGSVAGQDECVVAEIKTEIMDMPEVAPPVAPQQFIILARSESGYNFTQL